MSESVKGYGFRTFVSFYNYCITTKLITSEVIENKNTVEKMTHSCATPNATRLNLSPILQPATLVNLGNTCYLNAVLQILFVLNRIVHFNHWTKPNLDYTAISQENLIKYLAFYKYGHLSTMDKISSCDIKDFISTVGFLDNFFNNGIQQDAHEALLKLLDIFDSGITTVIPNSIGLYNTFFQGALKKSRKCLKCNKSVLFLEPFYDIKIMPDTVTHKAIETGLQETMTSFFCIGCNTFSEHSCSTVIYDPPRVLMVLVNRYTFSSSYSRPRRNKQLMTPEETISLFGCQYALCGVVNHIGASVTSGHYTSHVKVNDCWFHCNDKVIGKVDGPPNRSGDAYLLFYSKIA